MAMSDSASKQSLSPSNNSNNSNNQFQHGSSSNLTTVSAPAPNSEQFSAWQRQYQSQPNAYHSAMSMQQAQQYRMQQQQQQQRNPNQQQRNQQQQYQQQAQQQRNQQHFGSAASLPSHSNGGYQMTANKQNGARQRAIAEVTEDTDHSGFVPPSPQANEEIVKYVKYQAKRKGIKQQQTIEMEVARRQDKARQTEERKKTRGTQDSFKVPIKSESRTDRLESDIDYALMDETQHDKKCCCLVM